MKVFASTTLYRQTDRERVSFSPVTKQHKKLKQTYYYKIQLSSTKGCTVIQSYLYPQLNSSTSTQQHQPQHTHNNINHNIHTTTSTTTYTQQFGIETYCTHCTWRVKWYSSPTHKAQQHTHIICTNRAKNLRSMRSQVCDRAIIFKVTFILFFTCPLPSVF